MDAAKMSAIYDRLLSLKIDLNFNDVPTPAYIQDRLILCNEYQRVIEKFFIEVTRDLSKSDRLFRAEKLNIEVLKRQTLTNNERVKKLPTGKEREAAVDELLEPQYKNLLNLENESCSLHDLLSAVKAVQMNIKATNSDIKTLVKIMEQQIGRLNIGAVTDPEVRAFNKELAELDRMEEEMTAEDVESSEENQESEETPVSAGDPESVEVQGSDDVSGGVPVSGDNSTSPEGGGLDASEDSLIASFLEDDTASPTEDNQVSPEDESVAPKEEESEDVAVEGANRSEPRP
jgi:hypothetical protein